jgi:anti-anti-sigma factor
MQHRITIQEIDTATVPAFRSALDEAIDHSNGNAVELDLTDVTFMDSTGLAALIDVGNRLRSQGRSLRLHNSGRTVRRLFEITGLADWLEPVPGDRDDVP